MNSPSRRLARTLAEVLMIIPVLGLALTWAGIVLVGLVDNTLFDRLKVQIDKVMILLLAGCIVCFVVGLVAFAVTRRRGRSPE